MKTGDWVYVIRSFDNFAAATLRACCSCICQIKTRSSRPATWVHVHTSPNTSHHLHTATPCLRCSQGPETGPPLKPAVARSQKSTRSEGIGERRKKVKASMGLVNPSTGVQVRSRELDRHLSLDDRQADISYSQSENSKGPRCDSRLHARPDCAGETKECHPSSHVGECTSSLPLILEWSFVAELLQSITCLSTCCPATTQRPQ